jgi:putative sporulation protein YtaF
LRGIKISNKVNLWISVITFVISSLSAFSGTIISSAFGKEISVYISMILLCIIGIWIIFGDYLSKILRRVKIRNESKKASIHGILRNPENADVDNSKFIDFKEATLLGVALSLNNIGGGLSAGMIGLNSFFIGILSALVSFLALWSGNYITAFFKKWNLDNKATVVSGIILIIIGIKQVF